MRLSREGKGDCRARARAELDEVFKLGKSVFFGLAGGEDDVHNVVLDFVVDVDFVDDFARLQNLVGRYHSVYGFDDARFRHQIENYALLFFVGIADFKLEHKAVYLRFGKRISALLIDGVLRRENKERLGQRKRFAADCNLTLLHCLEQRALHLRGGAVDFVGEHYVRENRALLREKFALLLVVNERAHNVRRQQVGRELYSVEFCVHRRRHRFYRKRFRKSGDALQKNVPVCENARQQSVDKIFLPDDHFRHLLSEKKCPVGRRLYFVVYFAEVCTHNCFCLIKVFK